jgi:hypothetical protein
MTSAHPTPTRLALQTGRLDDHRAPLSPEHRLWPSALELFADQDLADDVRHAAEHDGRMVGLCAAWPVAEGAVRLAGPDSRRARDARRRPGRARAAAGRRPHARDAAGRATTAVSVHLRSRPLAALSDHRPARRATQPEGRRAAGPHQGARPQPRRRDGARRRPRHARLAGAPGCRRARRGTLEPRGDVRPRPAPVARARRRRSRACITTGSATTSRPRASKPRGPRSNTTSRSCCTSRRPRRAADVRPWPGRRKRSRARRPTPRARGSGG